MTEEVWSWWQDGSIHQAAWPTSEQLLADARAAGGGREEAAREELALELAAEVLREVRKAKSQAKRPMRAPVELVTVTVPESQLPALELGREDLVAAGAIEQLRAGAGEELSVAVELADEDR